MWDRRRPELNINSVSLFTTAKTGMKKVQKDLRTFSKHHKVGIKAVPTTRIFFLISINRGLGKKKGQNCRFETLLYAQIHGPHSNISTSSASHALLVTLVGPSPNMSNSSTFQLLFQKTLLYYEMISRKNHQWTNESTHNFPQMTSWQCEFYPRVTFPWLCGVFFGSSHRKCSNLQSSSSLLSRLEREIKNCIGDFLSTNTDGTAGFQVFQVNQPD